MELAGLEPATSWVRSRRSPKLSYSPAGTTLRMVAPRHGIASGRAVFERVQLFVQPAAEFRRLEGIRRGQSTFGPTLRMR
jgi:hypothetical protein